jgi:hypothetical protein
MDFRLRNNLGLLLQPGLLFFLLQNSALLNAACTTPRCTYCLCALCAGKLSTRVQHHHPAPRGCCEHVIMLIACNTVVDLCCPALPLVCSAVHPLCLIALHCGCCRHHQYSRREGCSRSGRAILQAACRYTAICTNIYVALLHPDDKITPQCCVTEGGVLLCFKQHWPDDICWSISWLADCSASYQCTLRGLSAYPHCAPILQVASNSLLMK